MYKVICIYCETENIFSLKDERPEECSNPACQHYLGGLDLITIYDEYKEQEVEENEKLIGLKLIYQKTSGEIIIKTDSKIILGRKNFGSEILGNIDQISRSHCSIEFKDNRFVITDLGSTNGTFIGLGTDRVSCITPQVLNEKDFLALGREVFLIQFLKEKKETEKETVSVVETSEIEEPKEILCTECSCILTKLPCSCPDCGTWNE